MSQIAAAGAGSEGTGESACSLDSSKAATQSAYSTDSHCPSLNQARALEETCLAHYEAISLFDSIRKSNSQQVVSKTSNRLFVHDRWLTYVG